MLKAHSGRERQIVTGQRDRAAAKYFIYYLTKISHCLFLMMQR